MTEPYKIASVDIGTNTLLMLVGYSLDKNNVFISSDNHSIARLGEDVDRTKHIGYEARERAKTILRSYKTQCDEQGVVRIVAVATSAVRDAVNGQEVCEELAAVIGAEIRVISGEEEARLSFFGSVETDERCTVIDIGGGSTEYVTGERKQIQERMSLQIGAVRIFERFLKALPPSFQAIEEARHAIREQLSQLPNRELGLVIGVGGTFTTLAALDLHLPYFEPMAVHNHHISVQRVEELTEMLCLSSLETLLSKPAIHPKRADILPAGALILHESLKYFGCDSCTASVKGLRYGVLYDTFKRIHEK